MEVICMTKLENLYEFLESSLTEVVDKQMSLNEEDDRRLYYWSGCEDTIRKVLVAIDKIERGVWLSGRHEKGFRG